MKDNFFRGFIDDLRVELMEEFDRNFEQKAFFDRPWPSEKIPNRRGSLLIRSGALRRSLRATGRSMAIHFESSVPYAQIQNEGGVITVTAKMQRFFWAMHMKAARASGGKGQRARAMSAEAAWWKAMALKKVGSKILIPERRFIGEHPQVDRSVERVLDIHVKRLSDTLHKRLKP